MVRLWASGEDRLSVARCTLSHEQNTEPDGRTLSQFTSGGRRTCHTTACRTGGDTHPKSIHAGGLRCRSDASILVAAAGVRFTAVLDRGWK